MSLFALSACLSFAGSECDAQNWDRFRGPNGSGTSDASTVPTGWTESDFNWRIELPGAGHASPVAWGTRLFLVSGDEKTGTRTVSCVDSRSGKTIWTKTFEAPTHRKHKLNSFASSSPALDEQRMYLCWATPDEYVVTALNHDGDEEWQVDLGGYKAGHGFGVSPIVFEDLLIVPNDQEGRSFIVALDKHTGQRRWKVDRETQATYSTPCVYAPAGRSPELIFTNWKLGITALNPATGRTNWEISAFDLSHSETAIGSPIVSGDLVYGTCGYLGYATHTVAVRPSRSTPGKSDEVFRVDRGAPLTTTPLVTHGLLVLWADKGIVTCVDSKTGSEQWKSRIGGTFYASPVAIGDAVYCASTNGEMIVLAASREFEELSRSPILETSHSSPAVVDGRMFIRTVSHLISIGGN